MMIRKLKRGAIHAVLSPLYVGIVVYSIGVTVWRRRRTPG
jgi:hypothetical protein